MPHPSRVLCGRVGILTSLTGPIKSKSPPCLAKKQTRQEPALSAVEGTGHPQLTCHFERSGLRVSENRLCSREPWPLNVGVSQRFTVLCRYFCGLAEITVRTCPSTLRCINFAHGHCRGTRPYVAAPRLQTASKHFYVRRIMALADLRSLVRSHVLALRFRTGQSFQPAGQPLP